VIYGNFVFPIVSGFSISLELGNISTTLQGNAQVDEKTNTAMYGFLSGKVVF